MHGRIKNRSWPIVSDCLKIWRFLAVRILDLAVAGVYIEFDRHGDIVHQILADTYFFRRSLRCRYAHFVVKKTLTAGISVWFVFVLNQVSINYVHLVQFRTMFQKTIVGNVAQNCREIKLTPFVR